MVVMVVATVFKMVTAMVEVVGGDSSDSPFDDDNING